VQRERTEVIEHEVRIQARPETVYEFFVDPDKMTRWKGSSAELDPRPGGRYRVAIGQGVAAGEFVELDRARKVVFTWGWEGDERIPPGTSTVEVTLTADGDGTILRLVHRDLPEGQGAVHEEGWNHFLPRLITAAAGGYPGPDPRAS
jgi:uncharacterized protein YndB with AHSA1/START domain